MGSRQSVARQKGNGEGSFTTRRSAYSPLADSYAEEILAWAPSRSIFADEFLTGMGLGTSADPRDRLFQRRISALGNLQLETIRLERKQRKEGNSAGFYKLEGIDTKPAACLTNLGIPSVLERLGGY